MSDFDDLMVLDEDQQETTIQALDLRGLDFSPEQLQALRAAGLLPDQEEWRLTDLRGVGWLARKLRGIALEEADIRDRVAVRLEQLKAERTRLESLHGPAAQEVIRQHLPRDGRGKINAKFIDLPENGVRVGLRITAGGPRIEKPEALFSYLMEVAGAEGDHPLEEALRVSRKETATGKEALEKLRTEPGQWDSEVMAAPVKAFVKTLPGVPDEETGEVLPATIPGVEIVSDTEKWYFEARKGGA